MYNVISEMCETKRTEQSVRDTLYDTRLGRGALNPESGTADYTSCIVLSVDDLT